MVRSLDPSSKNLGRRPAHRTERGSAGSTSIATTGRLVDPALPRSVLCAGRRSGIYFFLELFDLFFKALDLVAHLRQAVHVRVHALVFIERLDGYAPPNAGPHDFAG